MPDSGGIFCTAVFTLVYPALGTLLYALLGAGCDGALSVTLTLYMCMRPGHLSLWRTVSGMPRARFSISCVSHFEEVYGGGVCHCVRVDASLLISGYSGGCV